MIILTPGKSQSGSWTQFLKSIASFNGDLASITAPPFILSPVSLVEYSGNWFVNEELFTAPAKASTEEERFLAVVRWFIGTLRGQYCSRNEKLGSEKKPLNPFLGELFTGKWPGAEGDTVLVSEQVSHHPPVTGYALYNDKSGVDLEGYNAIKTRISTSAISVKQQGHAMYRLKKQGETYMITLPSLHIEGILFGAPYVELESSNLICSSTGYSCKIEYSGKGYFSGKKNTFKAKVYKGSQLLHTIGGQWSDVSKIKSEGGAESVFLDANNMVRTELEVKPIEDMDELESRRAWLKVAEAIKKGDFELISSEKGKIENEQRQLRKYEEASGKKWEQRWFKLEPALDDKTYSLLCTSARITPEDHWCFVREKFDLKP